MELKEEFRYPIHVCIDTTTKCNIQCSYCFEGNKKGHLVMSYEYVKTTLNYILENRKHRNIPEHLVSVIAFYGGEPLLVKELILQVLENFPLSQYPFFDFFIVTNGTKLKGDYAFLNECKKNRVLITVSYDGVQSTSIKGGHGETREGLSFLIKNNYPHIAVIMTVHPNEIVVLQDNIIDLVQLGVPRLINATLINKFSHNREFIVPFMKSLCAARNIVANINPHFLFMPAEQFYEKELLLHNPRSIWPYFLHVSGNYIKGMGDFGSDNITGAILGNVNDNKLSEHELQKLLEQNDVCKLCDCQHYRCDQNILGRVDLTICQMRYTFGNSLQVIPSEKGDCAIMGKNDPIKIAPPNKIPEFLFKEYWENAKSTK